MGDLDSHPICGFFGPTDSTFQMASRSVQPFLHSSRQSYVPVLYNVPPLSPKNAPSQGEEDLHQIYGSLSPPEPITRTASRSVQPFLHSSRQNVIGHARACYSSKNCFFDWGISTPSNACFLEAHMSPKPKRHLDLFCRFRTAAQCRRTCRGMPFAPQNCPFPWKSGPPSNTWFLGSTRLSIPNGISIDSVVFTQLTAECPYTLQRAATYPKNLPIPMGHLGPHLIHGSLDRPGPTAQTASRSVQPFL